MRVKDIMTPNVKYINPELSLKEAAEQMKSLDIGALPVAENDRLVGMITDRDITVRAVADGLNPTENKVRQFMTEGIEYCRESQPVEEAVEIMRDKKIRRLVVLNDKKRLVGFCSLGDIAVETDSEMVKSEALKDISLPAEPNW